MIIKKYLIDIIKNIIDANYNINIDINKINIQEINKEITGDYTLILFSLYKEKLNNINNVLVDGLLNHQPKIVDSIEIINGYLNMTINNQFLIDYLFNFDINQLKIDENLSNQDIMFEYCSPNTNKPLHLGHLRNIFLGDALSNIFKSFGHNVIKSCLFNDKGIHICKSMYAYLYMNENNYKSPSEANIKSDHFIVYFYVLFENNLKKEVEDLIKLGYTEVEAMKKSKLFNEVSEMYQKWENGDDELLKLWNKLNNWFYEGFFQTIGKINTKFDKFYYESKIYDLGKKIIEDGFNNNLIYKERDNSMWIDLTEYNMDKKLLLRNDGTSVYITQDLGIAELKYKEYNLYKSYYIIANEQNNHMSVLVAILNKLNKECSKVIEHYSYGLVKLPNGRMKTREGNVVDADMLIVELQEEIKEKTKELNKYEDLNNDNLYYNLAIGTIKYYILKVQADKQIVFDPSESINLNGNTFIYINFNYARIKSILSKNNINYDNFNIHKLNDIDVKLIKLINNWLLILEQSYLTKNPSLICNYVYELSKIFSQYYSEYKILNEDDIDIKKFRLKLIDTISIVIKNAFDILNIYLEERI